MSCASSSPARDSCFTIAARPNCAASKTLCASSRSAGKSSSPSKDVPISTDNIPGQIFDVIVRGGAVCDGSGGEPYTADVGLIGDRIETIGDLHDARAGDTIDASGMAVAPGFINMLSHSYMSLLQDPRSLGELKQGVTLQVFGEGNSMGPLTPDMHRRMQKGMREDPIPVDIPWRTLAEYLAHAERQGISQNIASYIGATTLRQYAVGADDRPATAAEMDVMRGLVRDEMSAGALGIGSSLIYPPAFFASTEELVELCRAAAPYRGKYISHMRSEGDALIEAVEELMRIGREAAVPAEIYHLKAAGRPNWHKIDAVIEMIERARAAGEPFSADMYLYEAGATGLSNSIPPKYHDGGSARLLERLEDPTIRRQIHDDIENSFDGWENLYARVGGASGVLILSVRKEENRKYQGKTMDAIATMMGIDDPIDALIELVRRDRSRVSTAYFMMSEDNIRKEVQLPWVAFGSDASSVAAEGAFLKMSTHPRAYGNFARLLGRYVRDEKLVPLPEAIRRLTRFPADTLELAGRGRIERGYFADIVVFDPATIADCATYDQPHYYAVGVRDVIVNGRPVLRDGEHTGEFPGHAVYGPARR
jgi:N-acyl-D-amino-acid deacylase